jgi:phosphatidylglycerophosphate synthase
MTPPNISRAWLTALVFTAATMLLLGLNLALGNHLAALGLAFVFGGHLWLWRCLIRVIVAEQMRRAKEQDRIVARWGAPMHSPSRQN